MTQQPHDLGFLDYNPTSNRSPSSSRQPYGAPAYGPGMNLPRQAQRQFESPLGPAALYSSDRNMGGYNSRGLETLGSGGIPSYMLDNSQSWNYNTSGAATVTGALNGPNRQRSMNRRGVIPQVRYNEQIRSLDSPRSENLTSS